MTNYDADAVAAQEHQTWLRSADSYAEHMAPMTATSGQVAILKEIGNITARDAVLEIGCGTGDVGIQLADVCTRVVGIDFAEGMIEIAAKRFPQLEFEVADAEEVPYADAEFDVVISNYTAHHFARPQKVFEEARRVLKPGGRLALIMPIQAEQKSFGAFFASAREEIPPEDVPGGSLLETSDPNEVADLLRAAGLKGVTAERRVKPLVLDSIDTLLRSGWVFMGLDDRPQDIQDRIRAKTIERAAPFRRSDGSYHFPDVVIVARGVK